MATAGTEKKKSNIISRNPYVFATLGFVLFAATVALSIYFTAGTTIPAVVTFGTKIGLDFGFLATMSPAAAVFTTTAIITGITVAAVATTALLAKVFSAIFKCFKRTKPQHPPQDDAANEQDFSEEESSTMKIVNSVGGPAPDNDKQIDGAPAVVDSPKKVTPVRAPLYPTAEEVAAIDKADTEEVVDLAYQITLV